MSTDPAKAPTMDAVEAVALSGALQVLAEYGVPPDFQEVLLHGNPALSIRPGVLAAIIAREVAAARPFIAAECAKVAEDYGPSRPMATNMAFSVIRGRWEGEQAASANIARIIKETIR